MKNTDFQNLIKNNHTGQMEKQIVILIGLLNNWSAVQHYKNKNGINPVLSIERELADAWKDKTIPKIFSWNLTMKVRRK